MNILVIDVGGTHVKLLATGEKDPRKFDSGPSLTPAGMVAGVKKASADWSYDAVSLGCPGLVVHGKIAAEPHNLGKGWVGFDFHKAFKKPVRIVNDAAMQALGSYQGGRMLFIGLGTGLGAAMIVDGALAPMEIGHLPYRKGRTYEDYVGDAGLKRLGKSKWTKHVHAVLEAFRAALEPDYTVVGGGNARHLKDLPKGVLPGNNGNAFEGGFRLWAGGAPKAAAGKRAESPVDTPRTRA